MSIYEASITNPKKQLEFYKVLSEQLQQENKQLKEKLSVVNQMDTDNYNKYCETLKENTDLKKQLEYLRSGEYLNQLKFERNMLENIVQNMEVSKEDKEFIDMTYRNTELLEENQELKEKVEYLKSKIENKDRWCQLIADIGYDYDGFNKVDSLKSLIDELVKYALYSRDNYDYLEWLKEDNKEKVDENN